MFLGLEVFGKIGGGGAGRVVVSFFNLVRLGGFGYSFRNGSRVRNGDLTFLGKCL